jgi:hypothetical protein
LMIIFIPYALLRGCFHKSQGLEENLAVINGDVDEDLIPVSLQKQYQLVKCRDNYKFILDSDGLSWFIKEARRCLRHPYFAFKLSIKIAQYCYLIRTYNPEVIITTSEYSFCSSALTLFLDMQGIEHINVLHGEKGFDIRDSFFKFSRCYVWEDFYVDLFERLKADMNQFIVERPPKHQKIIDLGTTYKPLKNTIKFYWASEYNEDELMFVAEHLKRIKQLGFNIIVRYHPLHKSIFYEKIHPFFKDDFKIEDPIQVTIYNSLLETEYVFGSYTTVLYEGYLMKRRLIINDFNYSLLLDLSCISIHLPHSKLSEFKG